jgi:hypothetical protein
MPEYRRETERCRKCRGLADALVEYQYSSQGYCWRVIHRIRCRHGCMGLIVDGPGARS